MGARTIIDAVGHIVQRGVLPSLRRLSLGRIDWDGWLAGQGVPRPDAAPHVETALLPGGRRPPGQIFWVTDAVLPDLHVALGMRAGYDWEGDVPESTLAAPYSAYEDEDDDGDESDDI